MTRLMKRMIDVDGATLEVFMGGAGRPWICSTSQWAVQTALLGPLTDVLAGEGSLVTVNPRDAGNSTPAQDAKELTMTSLVDDLEVVRQRLCGEPWIYVGHSAGGFVGLLSALRYPDGVAGLILADTAANAAFVMDEGSFFFPTHPDAAAVAEAQGQLADPSATPEVKQRASSVFLGAMLHDKTRLSVISALTEQGWGTSAPKRMQALIEEFRADPTTSSIALMRSASPPWFCAAGTIRWFHSGTAD